LSRRIFKHTSVREATFMTTVYSAHIKYKKKLCCKKL